MDRLSHSSDADNCEDRHHDDQGESLVNLSSQDEGIRKPKEELLKMWFLELMNMLYLEWGLGKIHTEHITENVSNALIKSCGSEP